MAILLNQGTHPFYQQYETESEVKRKIVKGELGLHKIDCSDSAMNLLTRLLSRNPSDRPSATTALLHPWLSTTAVLSQNGAGSAVLMDLTKNEQKISSVLKNLAMLAYVRRFNRALIVRPEMRLSISIDESKLPKFIRKNSHTDNENTFNEGRLMNLELYLPQKSTRSRLNLLPRERASYEDHKKLNISNFPRASNIKLLSNYNRLSSPRKLDASNKPIFLRDSIKSRIIKTMGKGYTESRSPDLSNFKKKLSSVQLENPPFFPSKEMTHIMQGLNRSSAIPTKTSKA